MDLMTGSGRPPIGKVVEVRLTPYQLEVVDKYAKEWDLSRAATIRLMVGYSIDQQICYDHVDR